MRPEVLRPEVMVAMILYKFFDVEVKKDLKLTDLINKRNGVHIYMIRHWICQKFGDLICRTFLLNIVKIRLYTTAQTDILFIIHKCVDTVPELYLYLIQISNFIGFIFK